MSFCPFSCKAFDCRQEQQAFGADKKAIIFDMRIDIAEKEYQIEI